MNKKTILYIDDDIYSLILFKEQMKKYDINVITEKNGKDGLSSYKKYKDELSLIILDINLPYLKASDLIKIMNKKCSIPIIIITASNLREDKESYLKLGIKDFYVKPMKINDVISIVDKYINQIAL